MPRRTSTTDRPLKAPTAAPSRLGPRRRATIMVFVLGVLTLLALLGLVLIARTHGDFQRVTEESTSSTINAALDAVVRITQDTLRHDIWGFDANPEYPLSDQPVTGLLESNEPYDSPGEHDRWLASTLPHFMLNPPPPKTGHELLPTPNPPLPDEGPILGWHRVSYLGTDLLRSAYDSTTGADLGSPFRWADNLRTPAAPNDLVEYGDGRTSSTGTTLRSLTEVPILQTPPPGLERFNLIPGSTTNITIAEARLAWLEQRAALSLVVPVGMTPEFPYFDTNADAIIDLYDADADGVPDSPLSFVIPISDDDPNSPKRLYAAVRIVDHASMLNVNIASSVSLPGGPVGRITYDETVSNLQRRGRRTTELFLDDVVHLDDAFNRSAALVNYRSGNDPVLFDTDIVKRQLLGGLASATNYFLYGLADEAALRHRGMMPTFEMRDFDKTSVPNDYRTIERALRNSLLWTREVNAAGSYLQNRSRWNRFNSNPLITADYEGINDATGLIKGWRSLLLEDEPFAVRRNQLTTISHAVDAPPDILTPALPDAVATPLAGDTTVDTRLRALWSLGMSWPVLQFQSAGLLTDLNRPVEPTLIDDFTLPAGKTLPDWARVQPIDLNMRSAADPDGAKFDLIRFAAAAMYMALDAVPNVQIFPLRNSAVLPNAAVNRLYLAWQFALNLADYRDPDSEPTRIEWPAGSGHYIAGVEKQPFFTEVYAYLEAGTGAGSGGPVPVTTPPTADRWFFAFELYVPPYWKIPGVTINNLYIRAPGSSPDVGLLPLTTFKRGGTGPFPVLDGATDGRGRYYVLTGAADNAPSDVLANPLFPQFYRNDVFNIAVDGTGAIELVHSLTGDPNDPSNLVLDVINAKSSGGSLAGGTPSGLDDFAFRQPTMAPGSAKIFSLHRSTKGWRFTTAWQVYSKAPVFVSLPGASDPSLGLPNATADSLDDNIPESIWPTLTDLTTGFDLSPGFGAANPFPAFDSPGELSRLFYIGPINTVGATPVPALPPGIVSEQLPVTALLAKIVSASGTGDLESATDERLAAGRIDFARAKTATNSGGRAWTTRLFKYFTTQSHLYDGIDNDGDNLVDEITEAADVLFRHAGTINMNTATLRVLRTVPNMSYLPISADVMLSGIPANPYADFNLNSKFFWDFPTALIAAREDREVPLRLLEINRLRNVATAAKVPMSALSPNPNGAFESVADLARLTNIYDREFGNDNVFRIDRFTWKPNDIALWNHKLPGAGGPDLGDAPVSAAAQAPFTPDFRYRPEDQTIEYSPIISPASTASDPLDAGGIRGRDAFLARWANLLGARSDVFTAYIALIDENGSYVHRSEVTLDRTDCFREVPTPIDAPDARALIPPRVLLRTDTAYADDTR